MKRILFIDMDGTLVDFMSGVTKVDETIVQQFEGHYDDIPGVFYAMMHLATRSASIMICLSAAVQHLSHTVGGAVPSNEIVEGNPLYTHAIFSILRFKRLALPCH